MPEMHRVPYSLKWSEGFGEELEEMGDLEELEVVEMVVVVVVEVLDGVG